MIPAVFSLFPNVIKTPVDLKAATTATYLFDLILVVAMLVILILVANMIPHEPGSVDNSGKKRRLAFFVIAILTLAACLGLDYALYLSKIKVPAYVNRYMTTMAVASVAATVLYIIAGFAIIKLSPKDSKPASIFPRKR